MSKYLEFSTIAELPKTKTIRILSKRHGNGLGLIKWFGRRRRYAFFPENETAFDAECLNDIISYMKELR